MATGWSLVLALANGPVHAQTNDPVVAVQPPGGTAGVGETFAFQAQAGGTTPFVYQWYFNAGVIPAATNASLLLTNLTTGDAGEYSVVVTNAVGSVTSSVVNLSVVTTAPRVLWVKGVAASGTNIVEVPLVLNANGRENSIQFSLRFDTNAFSTPTYEWAAGNTATIISSNVAFGAIGFSVARPSPEMFPAGQQTLGSIRFAHGTNATAYDGGLAFTNSPIPIHALDTNGLEMSLAASVVPGVQVSPTQPKLNLQTGLFEQQVRIANPSGIGFENLLVYLPALGVDTSDNVMSLEGASGSAIVDLNGDGSLETAAFFTLSSLPPGAIEVFTNGFYVTDHVTAPVADYYVGIGGTPGIPMPATLVPFRITGAGFEGTNFAMEWPTRPGRTYSVLYAKELPDLGTPGSATKSTNTVTGTGSPAHWVDDVPAESDRFYQVIESQ